MDRRIFCDQVLGALRRVTGAERNAIRAELEGHIEDHVEDLLELGYDRDLAEARVLSAMGDPAEIGRELDRQYPLRWLVIGRAALVLTILLALVLARPLAERIPGAGNSLLARWAPKTLLDMSQAREDFDPLGLEAWDADAEIAIRDVHFRVYQIAFQPEREGGGTRLAVASWRTNPLRENLDWLNGYSLGVRVNGETADYGTQPEMDGINIYHVWADPGDTLTMTWALCGETETVELQLPEVDP